MAGPQLTEKFVAALIGPPFGLKGFVKVRPFSGDIDHLLRLEAAVLRQGGQERALVIEEAVAQPPAVLFKFAGFDSPEAVKALAGAELLVGREGASPLDEGEFYIEDLKGLEVAAAEGGEIIGRISGIVEGGGGELAEIALAAGGVRLVPFRKEFFVDISLEKGRALLENLWILE
jgi:16S rRNA processing protein RimM